MQTWNQILEALEGLRFHVEEAGEDANFCNMGPLASNIYCPSCKDYSTHHHAWSTNYLKKPVYNENTTLYNVQAKEFCIIEI